MTCKTQTQTANLINSLNGGSRITVEQVFDSYINQLSQEKWNRWKELQQTASEYFPQRAPAEIRSELAVLSEDLLALSRSREKNVVTKNDDGSISIANIRPKPYKHKGEWREYPYGTTDTFNADIVAGESIRVYGFISGLDENGAKFFDRTYKVCDAAEYDSYNLKYLGEITAISEKTVSVKTMQNKNARLDLWNFCTRNHGESAEEKEAYNAKEFMVI